MEQRSAPGAARRAGFKLPPSARPGSQDERRARALEEQKRRRALCVNAARNIDLLSSLSLGQADDDEGEIEILQEGLGSFASMLPPPTAPRPSSPTDNKRRKRGGKGKRRSIVNEYSGGLINNGASGSSPSDFASSVKAKAPLRFANVPMFAELLELRDDDIEQWSAPPESVMSQANFPEAAHEHRRHVLPADLETGWVALAPIPVGKRCLAVSHQQQGTGSSYDVSNTHLHSRLKGTKLLRFPSGLPPDSILDCILDANWQENGIIHVLDIIRWRGTYFVDCEAEFRFWWRDARVSEITFLPPIRRKRKASGPLLFDYPISFLPVPHCNPPISLLTYLQVVIPQARLVREVPVTVFKDEPLRPRATGSGSGLAMEIDVFGNNIQQMEEAMSLDNTPGPDGVPEMTNLIARIETDGLLLYVSEASYQPGETPLSCWVPAKPLDRADAPSMLHLFEKLIFRQLEAESQAGVSFTG